LQNFNGFIQNSEENNFLLKEEIDDGFK